MSRAPLVALQRAVAGAIGSVVVVGLLAGSAREARGAGDDVATAQVLFEDGKRLVARGQWAEACPKLEESQRLSPAIGTEFNLADCFEHADRLASAWAAFLDVVDRTHRRGEALRETAARARADALAPKLGKLTIQVASRAPDLEVRRDGQLVRPELWGVAAPADAGEHRIDARAKGRAPWSATVRTKDGRSAAIAVPELAVGSTSSAPIVADAPRSETPATGTPTSSPASTPASASAPDHTAAALVLGSAVVFAGVGVVGLLEHGAKVSAYNADSSCPPIDATTRPAQCNDYVSAANTWNTVGIVGLVGSGVALVAGVTLWVIAPDRAVASTAGRVTCVPGVAGIACVGVF